MKGRASKEKGNRFEREIVKLFKELGYKNARRSSDFVDNQKVDLEGTGYFNVQCKHVEKLGNVHQILSEMPKDEKLNLLFHKRNRQGTIVCMTVEDFKELLIVSEN